jgi:hypothetical protein
MLSAPSQHEGCRAMSAQAVAASVLLSTDFRTVRGTYFDHFDRRIVCASADGLLGEVEILD